MYTLDILKSWYIVNISIENDVMGISLVEKVKKHIRYKLLHNFYATKSVWTFFIL